MPLAICPNNIRGGILLHHSGAFTMRATRFKTLFVLSMALSAVLFVTGCGMELETGYKYRPLNATPVQRRGYYASPYSQEKAAAEQETKQGSHPAMGGQQ